MSEYKIETGIPLAKVAGIGSSMKYPFKEMTAPVTNADGSQTLASFFVPLGDSTIKRLRDRINHSALYARQRGHGRFAQRVVTENGIVGVRVWRIE